MRHEIDGRVFLNENDYKKALVDKKRIDEIRAKYDLNDLNALIRIKEAIVQDRLRFFSVLGRDFEDEISDRVRNLKEEPKQSSSKNKKLGKGKEKNSSRDYTKPLDAQIERQAKRLVKKKNKIRQYVMILCGVVALVCFSYYGYFYLEAKQLDHAYDALSDKKEEHSSTEKKTVTIHYTDDFGMDASLSLDVLDEYKDLYSENKNLIGWIKIDDTVIDYPVMQCDSYDYYLNHNFYEKEDRSGSIFLDPKCNAAKRSTNLILYGHHMQSGRMFGSLEKYASEAYYKKHPTIQFDTIYEKSKYEIAFVFRSRVYNEEDVVFKYYQFIDAPSAVEFNSHIEEMRKLSLYDTGVSVSFGDQLITLSTCDYQEKNGRFVVVAKRVY